VATATNDASRAASLRELGCEVVALPTGDGRVSLSALLDELGRRGMTNVLVEGGSAVLGSCLEGDLIDEAHVFIAPLLLGGSDAATPMGGRGVDRIAQAVRLTDWQTERVGDDIYCHGLLRQP
jgi:diaminohydroxyphosphoribosylaminopyrimidine deaminase/5-amino-6-(5-phosphoribosylamino)uracil reductase